MSYDAAPKVVPARTRILEQAIEYTSVDRNSSYGEPEDNFQAIADLWNPWLRKRFDVLFDLQPHDVAWLMILMKAARAAHDPFVRDNYVDTAGYAACGGECAERLQGNLEDMEIFPLRGDEYEGVIPANSYDEYDGIRERVTWVESDPVQVPTEVLKIHLPDIKFALNTGPDGIVNVIVDFKDGEGAAYLLGLTPTNIVRWSHVDNASEFPLDRDGSIAVGRDLRYFPIEHQSTQLEFEGYRYEISSKLGNDGEWQLLIRRDGTLIGQVSSYGLTTFSGVKSISEREFLNGEDDTPENDEDDFEEEDEFDEEECFVEVDGRTFSLRKNSEPGSVTLVGYQDTMKKYLLEMRLGQPVRRLRYAGRVGIPVAYREDEKLAITDKASYANGQDSAFITVGEDQWELVPREGGDDDVPWCVEVYHNEDLILEVNPFGVRTSVCSKFGGLGEDGRTRID